MHRRMIFSLDTVCARVKYKNIDLVQRKAIDIESRHRLDGAKSTLVRYLKSPTLLSSLLIIVVGIFFAVLPRDLRLVLAAATCRGHPTFAWCPTDPGSPLFLWL